MIFIPILFTVKNIIKGYVNLSSSLVIFQTFFFLIFQTLKTGMVAKLWGTISIKVFFSLLFGTFNVKLVVIKQIVFILTSVLRELIFFFF